jgi:hypothetical protein
LVWLGRIFFIAPSAFIDALRFDCLASGELLVGTVDGERSGFGKSTSMLEFVEQLTHWRGDIDRGSPCGKQPVNSRACLGGFVSPYQKVYFPGGSIARSSAALSWQ